MQVYKVLAYEFVFLHDEHIHKVVENSPQNSFEKPTIAITTTKQFKMLKKAKTTNFFRLIVSITPPIFFQWYKY